MSTDLDRSATAITEGIKKEMNLKSAERKEFIGLGRKF